MAKSLKRRGAKVTAAAAMLFLGPLACSSASEGSHTSSHNASGGGAGSAVDGGAGPGGSSGGAAPTAPTPTDHDFDGDGFADLAMFDYETGQWSVERSSDGEELMADHELSRGLPVAADYDGDGQTDVATYRAIGGSWHIEASSEGVRQEDFGFAAAVPVPADYDGDGRDDLAVFHPEEGTWYLLQSTLGAEERQLGTTGDLPVPADYDGDGRDDMAVYRPADGTWHIQGSTDGLSEVAFGWVEAWPVPADYDGDGRDDVAVFHQTQTSTYYLLQTTAGFAEVPLGGGQALPVPADYDGDGRTDMAVFRPPSRQWSILASSGAGTSNVEYERSGIPAAYPLFLYDNPFWTEFDVPLGGAHAIHLPYDRHWVLEAEGEFASSGRIFRSHDTGTMGIDWFWHTGDELRMRLYRSNVRFTEAHVGNDHNLQFWPEDHYARTLPIRGSMSSGTRVYRAEYRPGAGRFRTYLDGALVADFGIEVVELPAALTNLNAIGFAGTIRYDVVQ